MESFEILGAITEIEIVAVGGAIREIGRLRKQYGASRWRKLKGIAMIRPANGRVRRAEIHWYEARDAVRRPCQDRRGGK